MKHHKNVQKHVTSRCVIDASGARSSSGALSTPLAGLLFVHNY